jgi:hypothetical protein
VQQQQQQERGTSASRAGAALEEEEAARAEQGEGQRQRDARVAPGDKYYLCFRIYHVLLSVYEEYLYCVLLVMTDLVSLSLRTAKRKAG